MSHQKRVPLRYLKTLMPLEIEQEIIPGERPNLWASDNPPFIPMFPYPSVQEPEGGFEEMTRAKNNAMKPWYDFPNDAAEWDQHFPKSFVRTPFYDSTTGNYIDPRRTPWFNHLNIVYMAVAKITRGEWLTTSELLELFQMAMYRYHADVGILDQPFQYTNPEEIATSDFDIPPRGPPPARIIDEFRNHRLVIHIFNHSSLHWHAALIDQGTGRVYCFDTMEDGRPHRFLTVCRHLFRLFKDIGWAHTYTFVNVPIQPQPSDWECGPLSVLCIEDFLRSGRINGLTLPDRENLRNGVQGYSGWHDDNDFASRAEICEWIQDKWATRICGELGYAYKPGRAFGKLAGDNLEDVTKPGLKKSPKKARKPKSPIKHQAEPQPEVAKSLNVIRSIAGELFSRDQALPSVEQGSQAGSQRSIQGSRRQSLAGSPRPFGLPGSPGLSLTPTSQLGPTPVMTPSPRILSPNIRSPSIRSPRFLSPPVVSRGVEWSSPLVQYEGRETVEAEREPTPRAVERPRAMSIDTSRASLEPPRRSLRSGLTPALEKKMVINTKPRTPTKKSPRKVQSLESPETSPTKRRRGTRPQTVAGLTFAPVGWELARQHWATVYDQERKDQMAALGMGSVEGETGRLDRAARAARRETLEKPDVKYRGKR